MSRQGRRQPPLQDEPSSVPSSAGGERAWKPPKKSDQPAGEEVVQVNDSYVGGKKQELEPVREQQHPTGG